jgi:hypothetical protein
MPVSSSQVTTASPTSGKTGVQTTPGQAPVYYVKGVPVSEGVYNLATGRPLSWSQSGGGSSGFDTSKFSTQPTAEQLAAQAALDKQRASERAAEKAAHPQIQTFGGKEYNTVDLEWTAQELGKPVSLLTQKDIDYGIQKGYITPKGSQSGMTIEGQFVPVGSTVIIGGKSEILTKEKLAELREQMGQKVVSTPYGNILVSGGVGEKVRQLNIEYPGGYKDLGTKGTRGGELIEDPFGTRYEKFFATRYVEKGIGYAEKGKEDLILPLGSDFLITTTKGDKIELGTSHIFTRTPSSEARITEPETLGIFAASHPKTMTALKIGYEIAFFLGSLGMGEPLRPGTKGIFEPMPKTIKPTSDWLKPIKTEAGIPKIEPLTRELKPEEKAKAEREKSYTDILGEFGYLHPSDFSKGLPKIVIEKYGGVLKLPEGAKPIGGEASFITTGPKGEVIGTGKLEIFEISGKKSSVFWARPIEMRPSSDFTDMFGKVFDVSAFKEGFVFRRSSVDVYGASSKYIEGVRVPKFTSEAASVSRTKFGPEEIITKFFGKELKVKEPTLKPFKEEGGMFILSPEGKALKLGAKEVQPKFESWFKGKSTLRLPKPEDTGIIRIPKKPGAGRPFDFGKMSKPSSDTMQISKEVRTWQKAMSKQTGEGLKTTKYIPKPMEQIRLEAKIGYKGRNILEPEEYIMPKEGPPTRAVEFVKSVAEMKVDTHFTKEFELPRTKGLTFARTTELARTVEILRTSARQQPRVIDILRPTQEIIPRQIQPTITTTRTEQLQRTEEVSRMLTPTIPGIPGFPIIPFIGTPFHFEEEGKGKRGKQFKMPSKYTPSLTAEVLGIYGKKPKTITGLEIRPIIGKKPTRKEERWW